MEIASRLIFILALSGCIVCYGGNGGSRVSSSDSEELSPQAIGQLVQATVGTPPRWSLLPLQDASRDVACFVLNVKQGNCVFLRGPAGTVVVDAGTQVTGTVSPKRNVFQKWASFKERYRDVIDYCFTNVAVVSFVITHLDIDHYLYVPFLARFAVEHRVTHLNFFIGVTNEQEIAGFVHHLQQSNILPKQCHFFRHLTPTRRSNANFSVKKDEFFPNWKRFSPTSPTEKEAGINIENILQRTLGSPCARFHTLIPINGLTDPTDKNAQSLVLLFEHQGSNILFTGDATGDTLEAILGNLHPATQTVDDQVEKLFLEYGQDILNCDKFNQYLDILGIQNQQQLMHTLVVSAISKRNRQLLLSVNLIMESHHGSDQKGCNLWLPVVIKMSGCNFCGSICSADALESTYGHPRHFTLAGVLFPPSAKGLRKLVFSKTPFKGGSEGNRFITKKADTSKNVFQTALVDVYQFLFTHDGMFVHYQDIRGQLTSTGGLSAYSRWFWDKLLAGELQTLDGAFLHGAFSANNRLLATKHIAPGHVRNTPALLTFFHLVSAEDQQLLLGNVCKFCGQFDLNPLLVFWVSPDMLTSIGLPWEPTEENPMELPPAEPTPPTNYRIIDVPNDGNCGIVAILRGLNPQISSHDLHQQILDLRCIAATLVPSEDADTSLVQEQTIRIGGWKKWLAIEDFQYIAQAVKRPIVVITNVDNVWNYYRFEVGGPGDNGAIDDGQSGAEVILDCYFDANKGCLFVYYESTNGDISKRHFNAIVHN
ncbi:MAG: hypothetical protein LBD69_03010 [Puniceicoccales bacterium]|jgi:hypothetical protein|nr:hypothetical protein [Puniceicoccales bacterium]